MLINAERASHWYDIDGRPRYDATLREARKENLLPSITSILSAEVTSHELTAWAKSQLVISALTLPEIEGETMDDRARRIIADSDRQRDEAAQFGSDIHEVLDNYFKHGAVAGSQYSPKVQKYIPIVIDWIGKHIAYGKSEQIIVNNNYGFAGKIDWTGVCDLAQEPLNLRDDPLSVIDWKTAGTKPGKKFTGYDKWLFQLAAYGILNPHIKNFYNVVISSTEPGRIEVIQWNVDHTTQGQIVFLNALQIFKIRRKLIWDNETYQYIKGEK